MQLNGVKRPMVGTVRDRIAHLLIEEGPHTFEEIATALGITTKQAKNAIYKDRENHPRAQKMFYIAGYKRNLKRPGKRGGGPKTPRWAFGAYQDRKPSSPLSYSAYHAEACKRWYYGGGRLTILHKRRKPQAPRTFFSVMQSIVNTLLNRTDK